MSRVVFVVAAIVGATSLTACSSSSSSQSPTAAPAAATPKPAAVVSPVSSPSPLPAQSPAAVVSPSAASSPSPATATGLPVPTTPSPTPAAPVTATPVSAVVAVWVAGTDGGGVYLRTSPHDGDRAGVIPENTPLQVTGALEEGDGQNWYPVKTPDGNTGYVPQTYTTVNDPKAAPLPLVPNQAK
jgi:Bacterial SH3 domain